MLCRAYGTHSLPAIEDAVQDALVRAMHSWRSRGLPDDPAAWIARAARNRLIDDWRRRQRQAPAPDAELTPDAAPPTEQRIDEWLREEQLPDSVLRLMFACCHPAIDEPAQVALVLKLLCGFSVDEIAAGLLLKPETVKKRVQRARAKLIDADWSPELPDRDELQRRLGAVHRALYLLFSEGHSASSGAGPVREDLCEEAVRLCHLIAHHPLGRADTHALLALMLFNAARLEARVDAEGNGILLADQDRQRWDKRLIKHASYWLHRASGTPTSPYHAEARIAWLHSCPPSQAQTDWGAIRRLYDHLVDTWGGSPVHRLNRAVAAAQQGDTDFALAELTALADDPQLQRYPYYFTALSRVHRLRGDAAAATQALQRALQLPLAPHQREVLQRHLADLKA